MKNLLIKLAWRILYRFSENYEWSIKVNGRTLDTYDGWISNPTGIHDGWIRLYPHENVTMERRLKAPVQVRLG